MAARAIIVVTAHSLSGGGLYLSSCAAPITFVECEFSRNKGGYGGGVAFSSSGGSFVNSTFEENSANWNGGGI